MNNCSTICHAFLCREQHSETTAYILIAIQLEERDLLAAHEAYAEYRRHVPMLVPRFFAKKGMPRPAAQAGIYKTAA